jgi:hypothetical protein
MNEASIIKLRECLMVDGWTGSVSDLTSIIEKIEKDETIKKFIFFAKSRYEKSFKDIKKNKEAFLKLENDVIQASTEFDYYTYFQTANCICFFNGPEKNKEFVEYKFGELSDYRYDPVRNSGDDKEVTCEDIVIQNNQLIYSKN